MALNDSTFSESVASELHVGLLFQVMRLFGLV